MWAELTIMVNNLRRVLWTPPPKPLPQRELARRKPGPIYDLATVQSMVSGDRIHLATEGCDEDLDILEWDVDDVAKLFGALIPTDYHASEWCKGRGGVVLDADAYVVRYNHLDECRGDIRHAQYYAKFGFRNNDPDLMVWLFRCHLSRERYG